MNPGIFARERSRQPGSQKNLHHCSINLNFMLILKQSYFFLFSNLKLCDFHKKVTQTFFCSDTSPLNKLTKCTYEMRDQIQSYTIDIKPLLLPSAFIVDLQFKLICSWNMTLKFFSDITYDWCRREETVQTRPLS